MTHPTPTILGDIIRRWRIQRGLSQEALAARANLHRTYMGAIERGEKNVTIEMAGRVAEALGTTLSALIAEAESDGSEKNVTG